MKEMLEQYVKRLDALTRRERVYILSGGAAAILAVIYLGGIEPASQRAKLLSARIADQKNQLIVAEVQRTELNKSLTQNPDAVLRERIAARRREILEVDSQLAGLQRTLVPPQSMAIVLEQLVGQDPRVRIVGLVNLPATPLVQKEGEGSGTRAGTSAASTPAAPQSAGHHVFKHGVQVRVEGHYLDVLAYIARIEKQPWQVYWGKTSMAANYPKVQVELTLYTLSLDKAWLVV